MELIKGAPVSAKIKEEVGAMLEKINGRHQSWPLSA